MTEDTIAPAIPEAILAYFGDNRAKALLSDVEGLESRLGRIADPLTQASAPLVRDILKDATDKANALEEDRKADQKPSEETINKIRAGYRPLVDRSLVVKDSARQRLNRYLAAEEARQAQEARDAATRLEEQRKTAEAAAAAAATSPFEQGAADDAQKELAELELDVVHAAKVADNGPSVGSASGRARAAGYRTNYGVKVIDAAKMVRYFAKHKDIIALAERLANASARAAKGAVPIPGCEIVTTRSAV